MKKYAVAGETGIWAYFAPTLEKSREIANSILLLEKLGGGDTIDFVSPGVGSWKAIRLKPEEVRKIHLEKAGKFIEIKRKRPPEIDAIYMTRRQTERESPKS